MKTKYCYMCGELLPYEALFCTRCGKKQITLTKEDIDEEQADIIQAEESDQTSTEALPEKKDNFIKRLFKKIRSINKKGALALLRSALMLILAVTVLVTAFLPFTRLNMPENDTMHGMSPYVNITPVRAVSLTFAAFRSYSNSRLNGELEDLEAGMLKKYNEIYEKMQSKASFDRLTEDEQAEAYKFIDEYGYKELRLYMMDRNGTVSPQLYITGALSLCYIALGIGLFALAVLNILSTLGVIKSKVEGIYKWCVRLLTLAPAALLLLHALYSTVVCGIAYHYADFYVTGAEITDAALSTLIISAVIICGLSLIRIFNTEKRSVGAMIKRGVTLALAITVICLSSAPIISTTVTAAPYGTSRERDFDYRLDMSFFNEFGAYDEDMWQDVEEFHSLPKEEKKNEIMYGIGSMSDYTRLELDRGYGAAINRHVAALIYKSNSGIGMSLSSIYGLSHALTLIGAMLVAWQMLLYFALGDYSRIFNISGKLLSIVFGVISLGGAIIFSAALIRGVDVYGVSDNYSAFLSAGSVIFTVFAVAMAVMPVSRRVRCEATDLPYTLYIAKIPEEVAEIDTNSENYPEEFDTEAYGDDELVALDKIEEDVSDLKLLDGCAEAEDEINTEAETEAVTEPVNESEPEPEAIDEAPNESDNESKDEAENVDEATDDNEGLDSLDDDTSDLEALYGISLDRLPSPEDE